MDPQPPPHHLVATVDPTSNMLLLHGPTETKQFQSFLSQQPASYKDLPENEEYTVNANMLSTPWDNGIESFLKMKDGLTVSQPKISPGNSSSGVSSMGDTDSYLVDQGPSSGESCLSSYERDRLNDVDEAIEADMNTPTASQPHYLLGQYHRNEQISANIEQFHETQHHNDAGIRYVSPPYYTNHNEYPSELPPISSIYNLNLGNQRDHMSSYYEGENKDMRPGFRSWQQASNLPTSKMSVTHASDQPFWYSWPHSHGSFPHVHSNTAIFDANSNTIIGAEGSTISSKREDISRPVSQVFADEVSFPSPSPSDEQCYVIKPNEKAPLSSGKPLYTRKLPSVKRELSPCRSSDDEPVLKKRQLANTQLTPDVKPDALHNSGKADRKPDSANVNRDQPPPFHVIVAQAILSSPTGKMILADIYAFALEKYPEFETTKCAWRNSIRHSLSVNNCFVKKDRAPNGRGYYWAIHPAVIEDFKRGDCNKRMVKRRVQHRERPSSALARLPYCSSMISTHTETQSGMEGLQAYKDTRAHNSLPLGSVWPPSAYNTTTPTSNVLSPWYYASSMKNDPNSTKMVTGLPISKGEQSYTKETLEPRSHYVPYYQY